MVRRGSDELRLRGTAALLELLFRPAAATMSQRRFCRCRGFAQAAQRFLHRGGADQCTSVE